MGGQVTLCGGMDERSVTVHLASPRECAWKNAAAGLSEFFRNGAWEIGILRRSAVFVDGKQVVGQRSGAIGSRSGGTTVDSEARASIDDILNTLRQHGPIEA